MINEKGIIKLKVVVLTLLIIVLVAGLIYIASVYPPPQTLLTVGSIGGAERLERYRNANTGKIELDQNEVNSFFQSVEWQNISKDPELLALFKNKDMMDLFANAINVKQFVSVFESLEAEAKRSNISTQEEFNVFINQFFDNILKLVYDFPIIVNVEQGFWLINLLENNRLDFLKQFFVILNVWNLTESQKFEALFSAACLWSFRSSDVELISARDIDIFKTNFTLVAFNTEKGFNPIVNFFNSDNFNTIFIKAVTENMDAFVTAFSLNQDLSGFVINNAELQYSISKFLNNTDISSILNSTIFNRIVLTNQDFSGLLDAIRY